MVVHARLRVHQVSPVHVGLALGAIDVSIGPRAITIPATMVVPVRKMSLLHTTTPAAVEVVLQGTGVKPVSSIT